MNFFKKFLIIILSLSLISNINVSVSAKAGWNDFFGGDKQHQIINFADGKAVWVGKTGWTAKLETIGGAGVYSAQIFRAANIKKGKKYKLKFTLESTNMSKWVFIQISMGNKIAYGKWIHLKNCKTKNFNTVFKAKCDANKFIVAFGGDFGYTNYSPIDIYQYSANPITDGSSSKASKSTDIIFRKYSLKKYTSKKKKKKNQNFSYQYYCNK